MTVFRFVLFVFFQVAAMQALMWAHDQRVEPRVRRGWAFNAYLFTAIAGLLLYSVVAR